MESNKTQPYVLYDDYTKYIPDLIEGETKAIIKHKLCTYKRTNYSGDLIFVEDEFPYNEFTIDTLSLNIALRSDNLTSSDVASNEARKQINILLGKD